MASLDLIPWGMARKKQTSPRTAFSAPPFFYGDNHPAFSDVSRELKRVISCPHSREHSPDTGDTSLGTISSCFCRCLLFNSVEKRLEKYVRGWSSIPKRCIARDISFSLGFFLLANCICITFSVAWRNTLLPSASKMIKLNGETNFLFQSSREI